MKLTKKIVGALAAITMLFASVSTNALAGSHAKYPSKPIEKTITFKAGGAADIAGRLSAKAAEKVLEATNFSSKPFRSRWLCWF